MRISYVVCLGFVVLCGCGNSESEVKKYSDRLSESKYTEEDETNSSLTDEVKNQIWWEVKQVSEKISEELAARFEDRGDLTIVDFTENIAREIRQPIAEKYDISYEELMIIFEDGESADWRTEEAP